MLPTLLFTKINHLEDTPTKMFLCLLLSRCATQWEGKLMVHLLKEKLSFHILSPMEPVWILDHKHMIVFLISSTQISCIICSHIVTKLFWLCHSNPCSYCLYEKFLCWQTMAFKNSTLGWLCSISSFFPFSSLPPPTCFSSPLPSRYKYKIVDILIYLLPTKFF